MDVSSSYTYSSDQRPVTSSRTKQDQSSNDSTCALDELTPGPLR